ncbi:nuclear transport factor 2 family protein [Sediminibacter sp. Hel_I_10]|uniref:nuclear transport factor 2 family protein n=1 Tax=Sediminibacter sp. Hel_I_10 TaxID=1392490 RepID=UPI0018CC6C03|nr:nuclear transport factor 2 family protein [Sediminibacter sp. Hel_I_10]
MNRPLLPLIFLFVTFLIHAQPDTEVFLFDFEFSKDSLRLFNLKNISDSPGYDNQPSFYNDTLVLFASTRNDQTDIRSYNLNNAETTWLTDTEFNEYSPLKIPFQNAFSAVTLEKDENQRLLQYDILVKLEPLMLIDDILIGYHLWLNRNIVISSILKDENLTLTVSDFRFKKHKDLVDHVGRSLFKIPSERKDPLFSFVDKNSNPWQLMSFDLDELEAEALFEMMPNVEDMVWLNEKIAFSGKGHKIYAHNLKKRGDWELVATLDNFGITNVTRLAISPNGKKIAIVGEYVLDYDPETPDAIVQQQLDAYNYQDIDMFLETYTEDVKLYNYPNELISEGKVQLRERYADFFENTPDLYAALENRTVIGNKVIDKEKLTANGNTFFAVAIYEVENGLIKSVTFVK